jgi:hypothetical protein
MTPKLTYEDIARRLIDEMMDQEIDEEEVTS